MSAPVSVRLLPLAELILAEGIVLVSRWVGEEHRSRSCNILATSLIMLQVI